MVGAAEALACPLLDTATLAGVWALDRLHLPSEEARLRQTFGACYSDYPATVRRWI